MLCQGGIAVIWRTLAAAVQRLLEGLKQLHHEQWTSASTSYTSYQTTVNKCNVLHNKDGAHSDFIHSLAKGAT